MEFTTTPASGGGYVGRYTSAQRRRNRFGVTNINTWTSKEGEGTEDAQATQEDIEHAEDEIDGYFSNSGYAIPFSGDIPAVVTNWATVLSAYQSYIARGFNDQKPGGDLLKLREDVYEEMKQYAGGIRQFPGLARRTGATGNAVTVVETVGGRLSDGASKIPSTQRDGRAVRFIPGFGYTQW